MDKSSSASGKAADEKLVVGIRLDVLRSILDDIDSNKKLKGIFGSPVGAKMGIIPIDQDFLISDLKMTPLTDQQKNTVKAEVSEIMLKHIRGSRGI